MNYCITIYETSLGKSREWLPASSSKWSIRRLKVNAMRVHGYFPIPASEMQPWVEIPEKADEIGCLRYFERRGKKGTVFENDVLTLEVN